MSKNKIEEKEIMKHSQGRFKKMKTFNENEIAKPVFLYKDSGIPIKKGLAGDGNP